MSAADILWGIALHWGMMFKLVPETPVVLEYAQRICSRPSFVKVSERDVALAAEHEAAVNGLICWRRCRACAVIQDARCTRLSGQLIRHPVECAGI